MLLYLEEFLDHSRLLISGRNKTYMDGQGKGSVSLLDAAALLLASAVRNPLSGLHRPSGAAWSWPLGAGCPTSWQQCLFYQGEFAQDS